MNCFFELPSSLDNQPTTLGFVWLESAFFFSKVFVCELLLIWTETFMIFAWVTRVFVHVYCLRPTRVDCASVSDRVMWYSSAAFLFIIILIVLGIFCFSTFTLLKCMKDIALWVNLLGAIMSSAFKYCRAAISFGATVIVVAHSMYAFRTVACLIHRMLRTSTQLFEYLDHHFTTNSLIRCSIFVYVIVWATDMFSLIYIPGLVILVTYIIMWARSTSHQVAMSYILRGSFARRMCVLQVHCFSCYDCQ